MEPRPAGVGFGKGGRMKRETVAAVVWCVALAVAALAGILAGRRKGAK